MSDTPTSPDPSVPVVPDNLPDEVSDNEYERFLDFITQKFYGYTSYDDATTDTRPVVRAFAQDFFLLTGGIDNVVRNFERDGISGLGSASRNALSHMSKDQHLPKK